MRDMDHIQKTVADSSLWALHLFKLTSVIILMLNTINIFNNVGLQNWNSLFVVFLNSGFTANRSILLLSLQVVGTDVHRNKRG